jgi:hypothetical protein
VTAPAGARTVGEVQRQKDELEEVRRPQDDELEGYIRAADDGWHALTVFGGLLAILGSHRGAVDLVHRQGLASLAERWYWWSRTDASWRIVLPQEASPGRVRVAVGYYSLPGVETVLITAEDLLAGDRLTLTLPPGQAVAD